MPVQYEGIRAEHIAVRRAAGVFDVSHMGEIETSGPDAEAFLQRLLSNDVSKIAEGGAQYALLCREDGGVLDDLFTYRLEPERYLTVTNAANHEKDLAWFRSHAEGFDFEPAQLLVPFAFTGPGIPRPGNLVRPDGVVTSGTLSPCLDYGIGMAYVPVSHAEPGTPIEVDVRGKLRRAEIRKKPLYPSSN